MKPRDPKPSGKAQIGANDTTVDSSGKGHDLTATTITNQ
jgi:hypothetical protein